MIKTTWRHITRPPTVSQRNAAKITDLIDGSKIAISTAYICKTLDITPSQFQSAKPYFSNYKTVGCRWYAPDKIEEARVAYGVNWFAKEKARMDAKYIGSQLKPL